MFGYCIKKNAAVFHFFSSKRLLCGQCFKLENMMGLKEEESLRYKLQHHQKKERRLNLEFLEVQFDGLNH